MKSKTVPLINPHEAPLVEMNNRFVRIFGTELADRIHEIASVQARLDGQVIYARLEDSQANGTLSLDYIAAQLMRRKHTWEELKAYFRIAPAPTTEARLRKAIDEKAAILKPYYAFIKSL